MDEEKDLNKENFYNETFNNKLTYNTENNKDLQIIACILALTLFPLFGIIFMCSYKIFNKKVRTILTTIFSFFSILSLSIIFLVLSVILNDYNEYYSYNTNISSEDENSTNDFTSNKTFEEIVTLDEEIWTLLYNVDNSIVIMSEIYDYLKSEPNSEELEENIYSLNTNLTNEHSNLSDFSNEILLLYLEHENDGYINLDTYIDSITKYLELGMTISYYLLECLDEFEYTGIINTEYLDTLVDDLFETELHEALAIFFFDIYLNRYDFFVENGISEEDVPTISTYYND